MNEKETKSISKFLSYILRHAPETVGLQLDENGWADVHELITLCNSSQRKLDIEILQFVVESNDKKRFAFNEDQTKIRASQGHSIEVDLQMDPKEPPPFLYHGTVDKFIPAIRELGLQKMSRQHVHLSGDKETALKVGGRRGKPVILVVQSGRMAEQGFTFYLSANGVWLCDEVPPQFIDF
ncbi:MAG: RNA 2'-phosphotransferase [Bacteroidota bacterium]